MIKRTTSIVMAIIAAGIFLAGAGIALGRVTVESGMPAISKMIQQGKISGAVRTLQSEYKFDNPEGLTALRDFSLAVLRQSLADQTDLFEQCYVATSLAAYDDWTGRAAIDKALNSSNFLIQKAAVEGLAEAGNPQSIAILERFYHASGQDGQLMAVQGLAEVRTPAVEPILLEAAKDPDSNLTVWSVNGLGHLGDRAALPYLHTLLTKTTDPMVKTEAAHAIVLLGDSSHGVIEIIEQGLNTNNVQEASEAALDLGDAHDKTTVAVLEKTETSQKVNGRVRLAAAVALTHYNNGDGMPLLKQALVDRKFGKYLPPMLDHLNFAMGRPLLIGALSSSDQVMRLAATEAIGRSGGEPEILVLKQAIAKTKDPMELAQIAWSFGRIGRPNCIQPLLDLVQNPAPEVRDTAADALARISTGLLARPVAKS
ncbi:MAG: HEAT repeat domain-containing protein [Candidatus Binataceae bacterium]